MLTFWTGSKERVFKAAKKGGGQAGRPRRKVTSDYGRLTRLSNRMGHAIQVDLFSGIRTFKRRISADAIQKAWAAGDYHKVMGIIPWHELPGDLEKAAGKVRDTTLAAADVSIKRLPPNANKQLRFDATNPRLRSYLNERTGAMIKYVENDAKTVVQKYITRTFTEGLSPKQVAENLKGSIGLLPQHETALEKYKEGLRAGGMAQGKVEKLGDAYEEKLLNYRVDMIAKTEVRNATNYGQLAVWKESATQGLIDKDRALKEWVVDGDPCEICEPMEAVRVGLDETWTIEFPDGSTDEVDIPSESHPHCMCGMEIVFNDEDEDGGDDEFSE
jgi:hypothetical protein